MKEKGFTLIELLVVISIIALLLAILMPSLNAVKKKASAAVCLVNNKNLSLASYMYQSENDGSLVGGHTDSLEGGRKVGWIRVPMNAAGNPLASDQTDPVTDEDEIRGIKAGSLFPYFEDPDLLHCPGDNIRRSIYDGTKVFVSYAIPRCLNGGGTSKKQIKKFDKIKRPAEKYAFVETAEERNWNYGASFVMAAPEYDTGRSDFGWWGPMALNHGDSSILGYCDGHAEVRKWRDQFTIDRVEKLARQNVALYGQEWPPADQTADIDFMENGWAYRHGR